MTENSVKLGLSFHRTFSLSRDMLRQVLDTAVAHGGLTFEKLRDDTTLGTVQVQAARRYAIGTGLLTKEERPSSFGVMAHKHDPGLSQMASHWVMHYHMSSPHRCGPAFWHHLVTNFLIPGNQLSSPSVANEIGRFVREEEGEAAKQDTLRSTATIFLGTYSKKDSLGGLGFLESTSTAEYLVNEPEPPSSNVFAYVLADYWEGIWGTRTGVNLNELTEQGGPASLLLLGSGETNYYLSEMQQAGLVEVQRRVPPYMVVRLWDSADKLLERLYD